MQEAPTYTSGVPILVDETATFEKLIAAVTRGLSDYAPFESLREQDVDDEFVFVGLNADGELRYARVVSQIHYGGVTLDELFKVAAFQNSYNELKHPVFQNVVVALAQQQLNSVWALIRFRKFEEVTHIRCDGVFLYDREQFVAFGTELQHAINAILFPKNETQVSSRYGIDPDSLKIFVQDPLMLVGQSAEIVRNKIVEIMKWLDTPLKTTIREYWLRCMYRQISNYLIDLRKYSGPNMAAIEESISKYCDMILECWYKQSPLPYIQNAKAIYDEMAAAIEPGLAPSLKLEMIWNVTTFEEIREMIYEFEIHTTFGQFSVFQLVKEIHRVYENVYSAPFKKTGLVVIPPIEANWLALYSLEEPLRAQLATLDPME